MRLVILESPFNADTPEGIERNRKYARLCVRDCLLRGESAIASHLLYTQPDILDDSIPAERVLGIKAGHAWMRAADACVVYTDLGLSTGMLQGRAAAVRARIKLEHRKLPYEIWSPFAGGSV